ncbi:hypothetical protein Glove_460g53 [Diversispora epigaea]|uniref:Uncharacterized protein n=1 Tax=Diversispora epigaea TaxID=1348612 RepID=A0A397GU69_9GLOM|nr:hypothetical protein Glove_460g53 [Diversispora epigaea]
MHQLAVLFEKHILITFYHDRQPPTFNLISPTLNIVKNETEPFREIIKQLLLPYSGVGYTLLMNFEREIELYLKNEILELEWNIEKPAGLPNRFILHLSLNDKFLKQQILRNSCLAKVINNGNNGGSNSNSNGGSSNNSNGNNSNGNNSNGNNSNGNNSNGNNSNNNINNNINNNSNNNGE